MCVIDLFNKYSWVVNLKNKKEATIVKAFQSILNSSKRKLNKIWVDKGSEFYINQFKKWLKDNDISMYSTRNEGKSVVAERLIKTLKNKVFKHMSSISRNNYYDALDDLLKSTIIHTIVRLK